MRGFVNVVSVAILIVIAFVLGFMVATPGKSESYSILDQNGEYTVNKVSGNTHITYLPDSSNLSIEEYEALAVIREIYDVVDIIY